MEFDRVFDVKEPEDSILFGWKGKKIKKMCCLYLSNKDYTRGKNKLLNKIIRWNLRHGESEIVYSWSDGFFCLDSDVDSGRAAEWAGQERTEFSTLFFEGLSHLAFKSYSV